MFKFMEQTTARRTNESTTRLAPAGQRLGLFTRYARPDAMSNVRLQDSSSFDILFATTQSIEGILKALVIVTKKSRFLWVQSMAAKV